LTLASSVLWTKMSKMSTIVDIQPSSLSSEYVGDDSSKAQDEILRFREMLAETSAKNEPCLGCNGCT
jgi:hypothetical protein